MFGLGFSEVLLIFGIALLVFGPKKLPELGKSIGRALAEFKKASEDFQDSVRAEMKEVEKSTGMDEFKELAKVDLSGHEEPATPKPVPEPAQPEAALVPEQTIEKVEPKPEKQDVAHGREQKKRSYKKKQKGRKIQLTKNSKKQKKSVKKAGGAKRNA